MKIESYKNFMRSKWCLVFMLIVLISCNRIVSSDKDSEHVMQLVKMYKVKAIQCQQNQPDTAIIYADSAIILLRKMKDCNSDTLLSLIKIKALAYFNTELFDSTVSILERNYFEAVELKDSTLEVKTAIILSGFALDKNNLYLVEKYISKAIKLLKSESDENDKALAYSIYGSFLWIKGENKKANEYLMKAYKIYETLKSYSNLSRVSINIGNNFSAIESKKDELFYYRVAIDAALKSKDTINLIHSLCNMGVYYRYENPDSALFYYNKVIGLKPRGKTPNFVISAKYNKASLLIDRKDYKKAFEALDKVLKECQLEKNYIGMAYAYGGLATCYVSMKRVNQAINYMENAIKIADTIGSKDMAMLLRDELQTIYEENANYKEAYLLSKQIKVFTDSTKSIEKQIAIHKMEANYQSEKKELENKLLKSELTKQNKLLVNRYLTIVFFIILSLILGVLLWRTHVLNKQRAIAYEVLMRKYKDEVGVVQNTSNVTLENSIKNTDFTEMHLQLYTQIVYYYQTEKPYLDPVFKVETLLEALKISPKAVSQALKCNNYNFNSITNHFRVEEAKARMADPIYRNYKIEAIAAESGFGTRMSFYNAFEQITGVKPGFYRNNINSDTEKVQ
ncbi:MAG: tetratricopeptide repeat protein [Bacteroidota bacterium]